MKQLTLTACLAAVAASTSTAQSQARAGAAAGGGTTTAARAQLRDAEGRPVGEAVLQSAHGILLTLHLTRVPPGVHALHIHATGRCEPPSFDSADGHFNPDRKEHGVLNPNGPHAGDLPNIEVSGRLEYRAEYFVEGVTLEPGPRSLLDADGSAVVIHTGPDDYRTDPAGDAGDRLACGAIVR